MKSICIYLVIGDDNLLRNTTTGPEHYVCLVRQRLDKARSRERSFLLSASLICVCSPPSHMLALPLP